MKSKLFTIVVLILAIAISGCAAADTTPAAPPEPPAPQQTPPPEPVQPEEDEDLNPHHNARNSLDWAGVYQGIVPSASGMGIQVQLVLQQDETFLLRYEYLTGEEPIPEIGSFGWGKQDVDALASGSFEWDEAGNVVRLDVENWPPYFQVGEGRLTQLDMSGNLITGDLAENYVLTKVADTS